MILENLVLQLVAPLVRRQHYEPRLALLVYRVCSLLLHQVPRLLLFPLLVLLFVRPVLDVTFPQVFELLQDDARFVFLFLKPMQISLHRFTADRFFLDMYLQVVEFFANEVDEVGYIFLELVLRL